MGKELETSELVCKSFDLNIAISELLNRLRHSKLTLNVMKIVTLNKSRNIINTVLHLEILYVLESEKLDGSPWGMSSHPNLHKCGKSLHPHLQGCFCGSLVDTYIHYLFYNSIFVHLSDL